VKDFENQEKKHEIPGHSMPYVMLGTMILMVGFIGFNGGSTLRMETIDDASRMSVAVVNTMLAAGGGGITSMAFHHRTTGYWSMVQTCNGSLAGMVVRRSYGCVGTGQCDCCV
jgi:Amt family ammonium transporter